MKGLHDVRVAPVVDHPAVIGQARDADVCGGGAAEGHLVQPEVGAVGEVGGLVGHFFLCAGQM